MDYKLIRKILLDLIKIDKINYGESKVLTIAHDNDRGFVYNGKYYSQLVDTIEDDLRKRGFECVSIARIISSVKGNISYGNVHSPEGGFARALLMKRLKGFLIRNKYPYSNMEERVWGEILDETKAEKVVGILPSRELCTACHKRGIWVADVQHGVIAENHPWYGAQFRAKDTNQFLPNAFLVWDHGSAEVLEKWAKPKGITINVIGNRWISRFKNPKQDDLLVSNTLNSYRQQFNNEENKRSILVGLSSCSEGMKNGIISESLIKVIQNTSKKYKWILRLHPNQLKGFASHESEIFFKLFKSSLEGHAEWEVATRSALPAVLLSSDLHIAWHSSVAIEGAQLGVKSALLDPRFRGAYADDYYDYYKKLGFIDFVEDDVNAITDWISANIESKSYGEDYENYDQKYNELISFLTEK
ncbi:hypothetical protein ABIE26_004858 [Pedobacter africanus]|uniref:Uncharacterized protein n=1 Tax=Pedobacter africanus TaxID=151894 RepID=A0ACC6L3R4_9SPHI|nr:hypothetical protein [Pedobacter africanus]MDR6786139.1 hypothetical protein [Pedobacter africanus]